MATKEKKKKNYLSNPRLLEEIEKSQKLREEGREDYFTPDLTKMIILLVNKIASAPNWRGYTYIDDMKGDAVKTLYENILKFNRAKAGKYPNPFAYATQIVTNSFLSTRGKEIKQVTVKDNIIARQNSLIPPEFIGTGLNSSFNKQMDEYIENLPEEEKASFTSKRKKFIRKPQTNSS